MINVEKIKPTGIFTNYIYKAIPLAFDESMSYYECLCGLLHYLKNTVIPTLNNNANAIIEIQNLFIELQNYVDNYFDNLDVQEEINNKLDDMVEQGTLQEIIAEYLQATALWCFDTVADMKQATNLIDGSYARTYGYHSLNDNGGAYYKITDTADENNYQEELDNDLYATLITFESVRPEMFGAYGDGTHNDTEALEKAIKTRKKIIGSKDKNYYINSIQIDEDYLYLENVNIITNSVSPTSEEIQSNVAKMMFLFNNDGDYTFKNCTFYTYANQDNTTDWLSDYVTTPCSNVEFLHFKKGVNNLNVNDCTFTNGIFDIWVAYESEELKGVVNLNNCESNGSCIFYDPRWVKENNIYNCRVNQGNNATDFSHCLYITFGSGMKVNIENCILNNSVHGGVPIDIYHGDSYDVYINNTDIINNNTETEICLIIAGINTQAIVENCNIRGNGYLLYQGQSPNSLVVFNNCNISCGKLNGGTLSPCFLRTRFINCDITCDGTYYYNNDIINNNCLLQFENCKITTSGILDYVNMLFKNCEIYNNTEGVLLSLRTYSVLLNNYIYNKKDTTYNVVIHGYNNGSILFNTLFDHFKENKLYQITPIQTTYINIPE